MASALVTRAIGVMRESYDEDLSAFDDGFLEASLRKRAAAVAGGDAAGYVDRLDGDGDEARALVASLSVGYSEFFRDPLTWAVLERLILPELLRAHAASGRGELRVWSAACASGEEAWSAAVLLEEATRQADAEMPYRVFATDSCAPVLDAARLGEYEAESVRNIRHGQLERHFERRGTAFRVATGLRAHLDFSAYDLLDECSTCVPASIYGDFDLILLCNVLLYYRADARRLILGKAARCLASRGFLVTGEAEREIVRHAGGFSAVLSPAAVFSRRG